MKVVECMESNTFKSVAFGGFDKQDVIRYIERASLEHAEETRRLQEENVALSAQIRDLTAAKEALEAQVAELQAQAAESSALLGQVRQEADALSAEASTLRVGAMDAQTLAAELAVLRPEAEAYRQFRNRIGDIECEAQKRAAELESATNARLQAIMADFRAKYQSLASTFDVTASHVNNELRKIEVNLSQLPRALDQIGADLTALEKSFDKESK